MTFNEEYAIEALWHEINHNRMKKYVYLLPDSVERKVMETINQLVSRHTYDEFLKILGATAKHKKRVLEEGYGYKQGK